MTLNHTPKTVDPNYDNARANYEQLCIVVDALKKRLETNLAHAHGFALTADQLTNDIHTILIKSANQTLITMGNDAKQVQAGFLKQEEAISKSIENSALQRLNNLIEVFNQFRGRIKGREEALESFDYYSSKVTKLHASRDAALVKGQKESSKDLENRQKTEKKLEDATAVYKTANDGLVRDLTYIWNSRFDQLGPVLGDFLTGEKAFASCISNAIQNLRVPKMEPIAPVSFIESKSSEYDTQSPPTSSGRIFQGQPGPGPSLRAEGAPPGGQQFGMSAYSPQQL